MRAKPVVNLLADLGVTRSHSRPSVSDDTPYSETAASKTRVIAARQQTLNAAYAAHPERFVRRAPKPPILP